MSSVFRRGSAKLLKILIRALDPGAVANYVQVYGKTVAGITQLFAQTSDGVVSQITPVSQFFQVSSLFGSGRDGAITFDGVATISLRTGLVGAVSLVPAAGVYTLTGDLFCTNVTIDAGVEVRTAGFCIFCTGTFTCNGTYGEKGVAGSASTNTSGGAGGNRATWNTRRFSIGSAGGAGGSTASPTGTAGTGSSSAPIYAASATLGNGSKQAGGTMQGGCGGDSDAGTGGAGVSGNTFGQEQSNGLDELIGVIFGRAHQSTSVAVATGGSGGGGGRGGTTGGGGGGGEGSPNVGIFARAITGTGTIRAQGGDGGAGFQDGGGGGGGGGGAIVVVTGTPSYPLTVTLSVTGGTGGDTGANQGKSGGSGMTLQYAV